MSGRVKREKFSYLSMCSCCSVVSKYSANIKQHLQKEHSGGAWKKGTKIIIPVRVSSRFEKCIHRSLENPVYMKNVRKDGRGNQMGDETDDQASCSKETEAFKDVKFILCSICKKLFSTFERFSKHLSVADHAHVSVNFKCPQCLSHFKEFRDLETHYKTKHPNCRSLVSPMDCINFIKKESTGITVDNDMFCPYCPLLFPEQELVAHIKEAHKGQVKVTNIKRERGSSEAVLEASVVEYNCPHCTSSFRSISSIAKHVFESHVNSSQSSGAAPTLLETESIDEINTEATVSDVTTVSRTSRKRRAPKWLEDTSYQSTTETKQGAKKLKLEESNTVETGSPKVTAPQISKVKITKPVLRTDEIQTHSKETKQMPTSKQNTLDLELAEIRTRSKSAVPSPTLKQKPAETYSAKGKSSGRVSETVKEALDSKSVITRTRQGKTQQMQNLAPSKLIEGSSSDADVPKETEITNQRETRGKIKEIETKRKDTLSKTKKAESCSVEEKVGQCNPVVVDLVDVTSEQNLNKRIPKPAIKGLNTEVYDVDEMDEIEMEIYGDSDDDYKPPDDDNSNDIEDDDDEDGDDDFVDEVNMNDRTKYGKDRKKKDVIKRNFKCSTCGEIFSLRRALQQHFAAEHCLKGQERLDKDGKSRLSEGTKSKSDVWKSLPVMEVSDEEIKVIRYKCPFCSFYLYHREYVISHIQNTHSEVKNFTRFDIVTEYETVKKDFDRELFKCQKCNYEVRWKKQMQAHVTACLGSEYRNINIPCLLPKEYTGKRLLASKLICPICNVVKNGKEEFEKHMKDDHFYKKAYNVQLRSSLSEPEPLDKSHKTHLCFMCPLCSYIARRKDFLQDHFASHKTNYEDIKLPIIRCLLLNAEPEFVENLEKDEEGRYVPAVKGENSFDADQDKMPDGSLSCGKEDGRPKLLEGTYICPLCDDFKTDEKDEVATHMISLHPDKTSEYYIHYVLPDVVYVASESEDVVGELVCKTCGFSRETLVDMVKHVQSSEDHLGYTGRQLKKESSKTSSVLTKASLFEVHTQAGLGVERIIEKEEVAGEYKCFECQDGFAYATKKGLLRHMKSRHKDKVIQDTYSCVFQMRDIIAGGHERQFQCSLCQENVETESELGEHFQAAHEEKLPEVLDLLQDMDSGLECKICYKKQDDSSALCRHLLMHVNQWQPHCPCCGLSFESQEDVGQHTALYHSENSFVCYVCAKIFVNLKAYQNHVKLHDANVTTVGDPEDPNNPDNFRRLCQVCGMSVIRYNYKKHVLRNHWQQVQCDCDVCLKQNAPASKKTSACDVCSRIFCSFVALNAHRWKQHPDVYKPARRFSFGPETMVVKEDLGQDYKPDAVLEDCSIEAIHRDVMKVDLTSEYPYICGLCGKACRKKKLLYRHVRRIHMKMEVKMYKCQLCPMRFDQLSELRAHSRCHRSTRPYTCEVCQKSFKMQSQLNMHVTLHGTGSEPKQMCGYCGRTFLSNSRLHSHAICHDKVKPYPCTVCNRMFTTINNLQRHMIKHGAEAVKNKLKCAYCPMRFQSVVNLSKHLVAHFPKFPFTCSECNMKFSSFRRLYTHKTEAVHFTTADKEQGKLDLVTVSTDNEGPMRQKRTRPTILSTKTPLKAKLAGSSSLPKIITIQTKQPVQKPSYIYAVPRQGSSNELVAVSEAEKVALLERQVIQSFTEVDASSDETMMQYQTVNSQEVDSVYSIAEAEDGSQTTNELEMAVSNVNNGENSAAALDEGNVGVIGNVDLIASILAQSEPGKSQTYQMPDGSLIHVIVQK